MTQKLVFQKLNLIHSTVFIYIFLFLFQVLLFHLHNCDGSLLGGGHHGDHHHGHNHEHNMTDHNHEHEHMHEHVHDDANMNDVQDSKEDLNEATTEKSMKFKEAKRNKKNKNKKNNRNGRRFGSRQRNINIIPFNFRIPKTGFSCKGRAPGYYADMEAECKVVYLVLWARGPCLAYTSRSKM